ncbi:hypothetical protein [Pontibacter oryzae]|uniref:Uncharacterized protein n=1 Tax=Pontibacter oryzae TaxID=2304593 RepID=A0A399RRI5_9BACT|nr:hypothetical protein [Pontibacter oryzae]RIJ34480.1 hypothetical protein D1627_15120 [Pontibacter oryzae]
MHTTIFKFGENSPYVLNKRPVAQEINDRLLWQAMRIAKIAEVGRVLNDGLVVYTPIPAYLSGPTTLEVYWDFKRPLR